MSAPKLIDLGFRPRPWQTAVLTLLKRFSVLVVHRQAGKTEIAIAKLVDAALRATTLDPRFGYVAPLLKQAKGIAWDRLKAYAHKLPKELVDINESELSVKFLHNGAKIRLFGADNPDSLRGLIFDGLVLDEVAQLSPALWGEVLLPTLQTRKGWALFIGTPKGINLFSQLFYRAKDDEGWFADLYDCYRSGVFTPDELADIQREMKPAQFRQEMLCDFAAVSDNILIPIDLAITASKRVLEPVLYDYAPKILGVDVAWSGGDRSVIMPRQGPVAFQPIIERGLPEKTFANRVAACIQKWQPDAVFVDTTGGYGGEVVSRLRDAHFKVDGIVFSWKATDPRFANYRAEMWFAMAKWMETGAIPSVPPELLTELCAPTYDNDNASNRLQLESKDAIRQRIGASVDIADALALTFAMPVFKDTDVPWMTDRRQHAKTLDRVEAA